MVLINERRDGVNHAVAFRFLPEAGCLNRSATEHEKAVCAMKFRNQESTVLFIHFSSAVSAISKVPEQGQQLL